MGIEELVNRNYERFSESDRAVWQYISANRDACEGMSISVMAKNCCVSRTAVMRFAQKLGFHGFAELKMYLKMGAHKAEVSDQIDQVCQIYTNVARSIRDKNCDAMFAAMDRAKQVFICGEGMVQTSIKREFKRIFMSAGMMLFDVPSGQELFNVIHMMTDQDLCILISVSGENEKMVQTARQMRVRGTKLISITKNRENTLAHLCDYQLYIEAAEMVETPIHWQYESTTSYFILIDILFLKYLEYHNGKEQNNASGDAGTAAL
ncbi:MAG: MurR/RpiR family transcriptional regulator [Eubacteriales bacterium]|nr:MurR/RpiR family transcriptional regulator [Eubacteriales bacterium]